MVSRVTIGLRVIIWLTGVVCGSSPSAVTCRVVDFTFQETKNQRTYSVRQILRREDSTQSFFIVNDKDAVGAFCSTELTSLGNGDILWNCKSGTGLESSYSALGSAGLSAAFRGPLLTVCGRDSTLARELRLDLLSDCLNKNTERTSVLTHPQHIA